MWDEDNRAIEAIFEPPSYQDLIVTPVGGALLGGFVFEPIRSWIKRKLELSPMTTLLVVPDPIGALNHVAKNPLGIKSDIRVGGPRRGAESSSKCDSPSTAGGATSPIIRRRCRGRS